MNVLKHGQTDATGIGSAVRIKLGTKKVAYPVSTVVDWLKGKSVKGDLQI